MMQKTVELKEIRCFFSIYRSLYFIIFFGLHQCLVKMPKLGFISSKGKKDKTCFVGLSMMCYTLGKEKRMCLGDFQLSGLMGKLLY